VPISQVHSIGLAMGRLKRGVLACCWIAALSLLAQIVVWSLATFTDMRYEASSAAPVAPSDVIVQREPPKKAGLPPIRQPSDDAPSANRLRTDVSLVSASLGAYDGTFRQVVGVANITTGVMLAAGAATPGVEKIVTAMNWSLVIAALTLPIAAVFQLDGLAGAMVDYGTMTNAVDAAHTAENQALLDEVTASSAPEGDGAADATTAASAAMERGTVMFYLRHLLLPITCIIGLACIGMRFSAGVEAAIIRSDYRLDPMLEREAANIKASSLHGGGRSAAALGGAMGGPAGATAAGPSPSQSATQVSPGIAPRRII
jgi:hypothetical protein